MNYNDLFTEFHNRLNSRYPKEEIEAIFFELWQFNCGLGRLYFHSSRLEEVKDLDLWQDQLDRLYKGEPLQHITGIGHFYGLTLKVNRSVLIPRPETEELVALVLEEQESSPLDILDVGTGSGCIALALKQKRKNWQVSAVDISKEALAVARENATQLGLNVDFMLDDICYSQLDSRFDVIVSNPPYIPAKEESTLEEHVAAFEPHEALFSPDDDPLKYYKCIHSFAAKYLNKPGGTLYFETHFEYAQQVADIFASEAKTRIVKDMFGKQRFVAVYY